MEKNQIILPIVAILIVAGIAATAIVMNDRSNDQDRFTVNGSGVVYAKADIANITVGLQTETRKTAAEATVESTDKMNNIITALNNLGIEEKDVKTTNYNLSPIYSWLENKGQVLQGYQVSQNVDVKVRDLSQIGDVIAKTTEQGANQVGNISFTIDDEYELKNQARELAITKAKEKAQMIADQAGMKLGEVKGVYEVNSEYQPMPMYSNAKMEMSADSVGGIVSPNIQSGQNEIRVEVSLSYEIK
ncbi:MAG: SIMPL domain-containing protein [Patescibacteria group bacterium]|nr:SIMPL domain-containing protein [Patescibacteria group bacterium]